MRKHTRKITSILLALVLGLTLAVPGLAADSDFIIKNGVLTGYQGNGGDVSIPDGVTSIGEYAFNMCAEMTSVTIPSSVTSIDFGAFHRCYGLTSVTIPGNVISIGEGSFQSCYGLTSVTILDGVTNIEEQVFDMCSNLTSVTIPDSITIIGSAAFCTNGSISDIYYNGSETQWNAIYIGTNNDFSNATIHYNSSIVNPTPTPTTSTVGSFSDVKTTDYFADPVKWAIDRNITAGTTNTTFSPNQTCTTAQILTFLWRAKGEPAPTVANPFSDVSTGDYYYKAALWAYENGLVSGSSFGGNSPCTRAQTVTYQWKLAGSPAAPAANFSDVSASADYATAVAWAVQKGVTAGTSDTTFSPSDTCTRGQIVTFLYRDLA